MSKDETKEGAEFSFAEIKNFNQHISFSIRGFDILYEVIEQVAKDFIIKDTNVYDLGCSKGTLLHKLYMDNIKVGASYVGYDKEVNLLPTLANKSLNYFQRDVTDPNLVFFNTNLILSVFTLQFLTYAEREALIDKVYKSLNYNGAFIVAEKIIGTSGEEQEILSSASRQLKREHFTDDLILGKEARLKTIMKPLTADHNESLFYNAGFRQSIAIWQTLNFKCWLLIK